MATVAPAVPPQRDPAAGARDRDGDDDDVGVDGDFVIVGHVDDGDAGGSSFVGYGELARETGIDSAGFVEGLKRGLHEEVMLFLNRDVYEADVKSVFRGSREALWKQFWVDVHRQDVSVDGTAVREAPSGETLDRIAATVSAAFDARATAEALRAEQARGLTHWLGLEPSAEVPVIFQDGGVQQQQQQQDAYDDPALDQHTLASSSSRASDCGGGGGDGAASAAAAAPFESVTPRTVGGGGALARVSSTATDDVAGHDRHGGGQGPRMLPATASRGPVREEEAGEPRAAGGAGGHDGSSGGGDARASSPASPPPSCDAVPPSTASWAEALGGLLARVLFSSEGDVDAPRCVMRDADIDGAWVTVGSPSPPRPRGSTDPTAPHTPPPVTAANAAYIDHMDALALMVQQGSLGPVFEFLNRQYAQFDFDVYVTDDGGGPSDATRIAPCTDEAGLPDVSVKVSRTFRLLQVDTAAGGVVQIGLVGIELECMLFSRQRAVLKLQGR